MLEHYLNESELKGSPRGQGNNDDDLMTQRLQSLNIYVDKISPKDVEYSEHGSKGKVDAVFLGESV